MILALCLVAALTQDAPNGASLAPSSHPMTLAEVVALASENAPAWRQARLQFQASEGGVIEAMGAFDPTLFADATYSYAEQPTSGFFSQLGITETTTKSLTMNQGIRQLLSSGGNYSLSFREGQSEYSYLGEDQADVSVNFNFTQPLLKGAGALHATYSLESARISEAQADAGARSAQNDVVQAAVDSYWSLAFARADVEVKEKSLALAERLREVTDAKFRVGSVAQVEVVQTEADIATRQDALLTARNQVKQAQDALRLMLYGLEGLTDWQTQIIPVDEPTKPNAQSLSWQMAWSVAQETRADLEQLRLASEQSDLDLRVAKDNLKPKLDLIISGNAFDQQPVIGRALSDLRNFDYPGYSVGLVFEMPLGNQQYKGAARRAKYSHALAQRQWHDREKEVIQEVRDAVRNMTYLSERIRVTSKARQVAFRQLEAEQRRLEGGASTNFQVLQFQTDLAVAESSEIQARMEYAKATVKLYTVQGLSWQGE
ncbi:MAG: TolC family protein [Planctomycetes bacterium]|jgi:outer membrane protein|nr:TolC family protein [Planctomycetota bacterium]MBT4028445.1 TolC family protein [Planctomycetota bacterium]MBT4559684.1 TolC family protein [Planctomycetota bacterium]MBT5119965.1 TolC family protein [Planctomycetota bacterium]MBT7319498.1 TolC family protein [Planctomycetota bacterium]